MSGLGQLRSNARFLMLSPDFSEKPNHANIDDRPLNGKASPSGGGRDSLNRFIMTDLWQSSEFRIFAFLGFLWLLFILLERV